MPERFEALWFSSHLRLTPFEFKLLYCLLLRYDQTVPIKIILIELWGYNLDVDFCSVRFLVRDLRRKLNRDSRKSKYIKTIYGKGYCLLLD